jgi:phosphatidylserine/phosphatidylglycerophosphate/cardiolipin synthase-like enzyme
MMWVYIGIGFTGAMTLLYLLRVVARRLGMISSFEVHFSPKGGCQDVVVREVKRARREVLVQAYSFTSEPISTALVEAKKRGVRVDILLDRSNETETYSDLNAFLQHGLPPLIDANHSIAHNKVMIIDQRTVITGSFNFTHQAENENAENLLVVKSHPDLIKAYRANFLAHKSHCRPPQVKTPPQAVTAHGPHSTPAAPHGRAA